MFVCSKQTSCLCFSVASIGKTLGLERKDFTLRVAPFIQGPASAPQIFEAPSLLREVVALLVLGVAGSSSHVEPRRRLDPAQAPRAAGGAGGSSRWLGLPEPALLLA